MQKLNYRSIENRRIKITDPLFSHYVDMIPGKVLMYQWDILNDRVEGAERSNCLENFRIAAGDSEGDFYGAVFQDTDAYKWLEAVSYCIESGHGDTFSEIAEYVVDLIVRAQQPDGYINTYFTIKSPGERWTNLVEGHELYNAGYLIEAAVAYYRATGRSRLLEAAVRFADLIVKTFGRGEGQINGYPGHQEIEIALIKLFRLSGNEDYLRTARYFIDERGASPNFFLEEIRRRNEEYIYPEFMNYKPEYSQSHIPPADQKNIEGHAVRAMYMCASMTDLAQEYDDQDLASSCAELWQSTTQRRMFITGGVGSSGFLERFTADYHLPNAFSYCETCASVGLMMFGQRMASLNGEAEYYEAVERALFNTVLAGISADGTRFFYVNPLEVWPDACLDSTSLAHVKPVRQKWFSVACCPTNVARTLASLGQYIYATDGDSLYIHQFISSEIDASDEFALTMDADIVRTGRVTIKTPAAVKLKVRIPSWAGSVEVFIDTSPAEPVMEHGYLAFILGGASTVELNLGVEPRWVAANDNVREDAGKAALMYGPFVYCIEETDNGDKLSSVSFEPDSKISTNRSLGLLPGNMPVLEYDGYRTESGVEGLYKTPEFRLKQVRLSAVPYCLWANRDPGEMLVWQKVRL